MTINLLGNDWTDETDPLLEVQNFIKDSEVIYESLSTNESDVKTEAALTALGDNNAKHPNVININISGIFSVFKSFM